MLYFRKVHHIFIYTKSVLWSYKPCNKEILYCKSAMLAAYASTSLKFNVLDYITSLSQTELI